MTSTSRHQLHTPLLLAGLLLASFAMLPYLLLGTGSIVTYHDQLDGELLSYLLSARYFGTSTTVYPEILGGLPATGAVAPAPLFVLLYVCFTPWSAFCLSQWIIFLIGFAGMYLLLEDLSGNRHPVLSFCGGVIFMLLPFYPVYGLCIPGVPFLYLAIRKVSAAQISCRTGLFAALIAVLYAASSSLVLVGYAVLLCMGIHTLIALIRKDHALRMVLLMLLMLVVYLICNRALLLQVLFPELGYVSHKSEYVISAESFFNSFYSAFTAGVSYAQSFHLIALPFAALLILCLCVAKHSASAASTPLRTAVRSFAAILAICLCYALYHTAPIAQLRNSTGGIFLEFNLDRITWLLPVLWMVAIFSLLSAAADSIPKARRIPALCTRALILILILSWGLQVSYHSALKPNVSKLIKGGDYYALDWDRFFASDIFEQINEAIGEDKSSYYTLSIGIYPAAAAYNGFYCLDGYSNNYPLTYKHEFRQIIAGELNKSEFVRALFDDWGNRCYVTTAEQNNYYTFEKKWNSAIYDLQLDISKLQEMNCRYIFSAAYLCNAEELGLSLLQDTPFETEGSWYHIYVYCVP